MPPGMAKADLIVVGTPWPSGLERLIIGSVADQLVRLSPVSTLLVRKALMTNALPRRQGRTPSLDIRLLGRLLGDTVREQEGDAVFALVERVRQTAVRFAGTGTLPGPSSLPCSILCLGIPPGQSSAPSAISCGWPTSPRISTTSAVAGLTISPIHLPRG